MNVAQLLNEAVAHHRSGRLAEADALYRRILLADPDQSDALHLLGLIAHQSGESAGAVELIERAVAARPDFAEAHSDLGNALAGLSRLTAAEAAYARAIELKPDFAEAHVNLADLLRRLGRLAEAEAASGTAVALRPDMVEARMNLGVVLKLQSRLAEAEAAFREAVRLAPDFAATHSNLGNALQGQGRLGEAEEAYRRALELKPGFATAHNNLANALKEQGRLGEADAAYRRALELDPGSAEAHGNLLLCMHCDPRFSAADIFAESRRWETAHAAPLAAAGRPHLNAREPERRLRVGYLSTDFREHSVGFFIEPLLAAHDRGEIEAVCYADVAAPDEMTARFEALADQWRWITGEAAESVAERVRADGIDILVDLGGHTANNRLLVFAARPAPVQASWLGYPGTTGMAAMDYRLVDAVTEPAGEAERASAERLLRLPNGFHCYAPPADAPAVSALPAARTGHVTFGSFNNLAKVTPEVVAAWARILDRVAGSRMVIKSKALSDAGTRARYAGLFAGRGIDPARIELVSWIPSKSGHLGAYEAVDIGLDPFPYNGTTTTCEALWMGVPVVTLVGDRHAGRVGASLLSRVDLGDLAAAGEDAYVETAVGLAEDRERLAALRAGLRPRMAASPLRDAAAFAREVEAAYREMWRRWCEIPPE